MEWGTIADVSSAIAALAVAAGGVYVFIVQRSRFPALDFRVTTTRQLCEGTAITLVTIELKNVGKVQIRAKATASDKDTGAVYYDGIDQVRWPGTLQIRELDPKHIAGIGSVTWDKVPTDWTVVDQLQVSGRETKIAPSGVEGHRMGDDAEHFDYLVDYRTKYPIRLHWFLRVCRWEPFGRPKRVIAETEMSLEPGETITVSLLLLLSSGRFLLRAYFVDDHEGALWHQTVFVDNTDIATKTAEVK